jgi:hypothetical protein
VADPTGTLIRPEIVGQNDVSFGTCGQVQRAFVGQTSPWSSDWFGGNRSTDLARGFGQYDAGDKSVSVREVFGRKRDASEFHLGRHGTPVDIPLALLIRENEKRVSTGRQVNSVEQRPIDRGTCDDDSGKAKRTLGAHRQHANSVPMASGGRASLGPGGARYTEPDPLPVVEPNRWPSKCCRGPKDTPRLDVVGGPHKQEAGTTLLRPWRLSHGPVLRREQIEQGDCCG